MNKDNNLSNQEWNHEIKHRERQERINAMKDSNGEKRLIKPKRRLGQTVLHVIAAVLVVLVLLWGTFTLGLMQKVVHPVTVGDSKVSVNEYNYFYNSAYQQFNQYAAQGVLPSTNGALDLNALCSLPEYNQITWGEYLDVATTKQLQELEVLVAEAKAKGLTVDEAHQKRIDAQIEATTKNFGGNVVETENALVKAYGRGTTLDVLRGVLTKLALAEEFTATLPDTIEISKDEVDKFYNDHKDTIDQVSYRSFTFSLEKESEAEMAEAPEKREARRVEKMAKLQETVDLFKKAVFNEASFIAQAAKYAPEAEKAAYAQPEKTKVVSKNKGTISNPEVAEWLYSADRKNGDFNVFKGYNSFQAIFYIERSKDTAVYPTLGRILFNINGEIAKDADAKDAKAKAIEAMVKTAEAKLPSISDEASLNAALNELSEAGENVVGGWIEDHPLINLDPAVATWVSNPARKAGDKTVISTANGCEIVVYGAAGTKEAWYKSVESNLMHEKLTAEVEKLISLDKYKVSTSKLGMFFVDKLAKNTVKGADLVKAAQEAEAKAKSEAAATTEGDAKSEETKADSAEATTAAAETTAAK